jgi:glycosyltransferase involved in cell wall biosynthesis
MNFSLIVPVFNEEGSIPKLLQSLQSALSQNEFIADYEIVVVDDGSSDRTTKLLKESETAHLKIIKLDRNYGQTTAIYAGIKNSQYSTLGIIDGDLQTDPNDFVKLIRKLNEGYDCVTGKRTKRRDSLKKRISTFIARKVRQVVMKDDFHDITCPLKVMKRETVDGITFFDTFHRFIPFIVQMQGYRVAEIEINHYPRFAGKSHYGTLDRLFVGIKSMRAIKWMQQNTIKYKLKND